MRQRIIITQANGLRHLEDSYKSPTASDRVIASVEAATEGEAREKLRAILLRKLVLYSDRVVYGIDPVTATLTFTDPVL